MEQASSCGAEETVVVEAELQNREQLGDLREAKLQSPLEEAGRVVEEAAPLIGGVQVDRLSSKELVLCQEEGGVVPCFDSVEAGVLLKPGLQLGVVLWSNLLLQEGWEAASRGEWVKVEKAAGNKQRSSPRTTTLRAILQHRQFAATSRQSTPIRQRLESSQPLFGLRPRLAPSIPVNQNGDTM